MIATGSGILCPACGSPESGVVDSRPGANYIRRRRKCMACVPVVRFTTVEVAVPKGASREESQIYDAFRFQAELQTLPVQEQLIIRKLLSALLAKRGVQSE